MKNYKFFDKTKIAALALSGVTLLSSCGKNNEETPKLENSILIETEDNKETTSKIEKQTTNNNEKNKKSNSNIDNNEDKTKEKDKTKTDNKTENKNETKTDNKIETTKENKVETPKEAKIQTTKIKNSDIKVTTTKAIQTEPPVQITQAPTTQVIYLNVSDRTDYTKYDLLNDDAFEAKSALHQLSKEFGTELYNGHFLENQYGTSFGTSEAYAIIANLNYNQGINIKALGDWFVDASEEQFLQYSDNMNLAYYQYIFGSRIDFTKYVLDEDLANFLNRVTDEYIEYMNGNTDPLTQEMEDFFENNNAYDNCIKYYFMCNTRDPQNYYSDEMNEARQAYFDNVTSPLFKEIEPNKGKIRKIIYK